MKPLISFLLKIICSAIAIVMLYLVLIIALILWNGEYLSLTSKIMEEIWKNDNK